MSGEPDITELHGSETPNSGKPNLGLVTRHSEFLSRPAVASPAREKPRVADFKKRPAYRVATNGESHPDANAMGTRPQSGRTLYPIKNKTHFVRRARKYREHESKGCADKARYPTHAEAHEAIRGIIRKPGKKRSRSLKSYPCNKCHGWHIHST